MNYPPNPPKGVSVFSGVLLALIVFFVVLPIGGIVTCVVCAGVEHGVARANVTTNTDSAKSACSSVKSATLLWMNAHPDRDCPTVYQLASDRFLPAHFALKDEWGNTFQVACGADEITCSTAGPDGVVGTRDDIIVPPPESTSTLEPTAIAERSPSLMVSFANFKDGLLDECVDITINLPRGTDAGPGALAKGADGVEESFLKARPSLSRIRRSCDAQFRENTFLASCAIHIDSSQRPSWKVDSGLGQVTITVYADSRYYNLDTLTKDDGYMQDCLSMKGDWQAIDKNSDAYRDAERARVRRDLSKGLKALGR
jgi:hypothetical protein